MKCDIISAGVGGQGVLSVSAIIAAGALNEGLYVKQAETHGMSQRGGAVVTHLRLSDAPIESDLIPRGSAEMIVSMELLESLRYLDYLRPGGSVLTSTEALANIPNYPDRQELLDRIRAMPGTLVLDAPSLARASGSARASNMVMIGAASPLLPIGPATIESHIREVFAGKGEKVVETNVRAFRAGREAAQCQPA